MSWDDACKLILGNYGVVRVIYRIVEYDMDGHPLRECFFEKKRDAVRFMSEMFKHDVDCDMEEVHFYTEPKFKEN